MLGSVDGITGELPLPQERMKAVNAYYCKHKTLEGCPGLDPVQFEKLKASMARDWHPEPKPYPSFRLTNNNAMIRQTKKRIEELSAKKEVEFFMAASEA